MAPRSTGPWLGGRVGVEAAPGTQAHEETQRQVSQGEAELDGIVACIEAEDRESKLKMGSGGNVSRACTSHERICSAATRFTFSPGMMRRTRSGAVQLEPCGGSCASQE